MLLQALGNFYSGIGMMLGGGQMMPSAKNSRSNLR